MRVARYSLHNTIGRSSYLTETLPPQYRRDGNTAAGAAGASAPTTPALRKRGVPAQNTFNALRAHAPSYKYLGFRLHEREEDRLANTGLTHHGTRTLRILIASQQHNQTVNTQANTTHRGCTVLQGT